MTKRIVILGSTGSIGTQTLDVAERMNIQVAGLSAHSNTEKLREQMMVWKPEAVSVRNEKQAAELSETAARTGTRIFVGDKGLVELAAMDGVDTVVTSVVGSAGLRPTMAAIRAGRRIALANKETLVAAGELVMSEARRYGAEIIPVDSEHSALFQCLHGERACDVEKLILTASGGPFRGRKAAELADVTPEQALKHPRWSMGPKISVDSSTLMNKGLEVIEARWLFDVDPDRIDVLVHPESIIHSMVSFKDSSVMAQLGMPDMRMPIQYAFTWPDRAVSTFERLDLSKIAALHFEAPDYSSFPCLGIAFDALRSGGTTPAVMNAANEEAVALFLQKRIGYNAIPELIMKAMSQISYLQSPDIDEIFEADRKARILIQNVAG